MEFGPSWIRNVREFLERTFVDDPRWIREQQQLGTIASPSGYDSVAWGRSWIDVDGRLNIDAFVFPVGTAGPDGGIACRVRFSEPIGDDFLSMEIVED